MTTATLPAVEPVKPSIVRHTPDDVIRLEEQGLYELVDGQLVEKGMSSLANETVGIITFRLGMYREQTSAGKIYPEQSFQCFPHDPELIRRPDISFVATARLSGVAEEGHIKIAPDLVVEVISPNDKVYELEEKLQNYRSAGVKLIWIVNPKHRWVRVFTADRTFTELNENDPIIGGDVLPGFAATVRDLLPTPLPPAVVEPAPAS